MKILFIILISLNAFASDFPEDKLLSTLLGMKSDSGIHGPTYAQIVADLNNLPSLFPNVAEVVEYGKSLKGKPLTLVKIAFKNIKKNGKAIYIGGSIHGNEYLNIEDRLPEWFARNSSETEINKYLKNGGVIYLAPILNPDGYDNRERENDHGVDLNRDFTVLRANVTGFKEIETKSLFEYLKEDLEKSSKKLLLAMDYHCCIGALLYPWSFTGPQLSTGDKNKHIKIGELMQTRLSRDLKVGQTPVILGYDAKGTSKDFYYEHFGALGFTFEGRYNKEDRYFEEHTQMWTDIIAYINSL